MLDARWLRFLFNLRVKHNPNVFSNIYPDDERFSAINFHVNNQFRYNYVGGASIHIIFVFSFHSSVLSGLDDDGLWIDPGVGRRWRENAEFNSIFKNKVFISISMTISNDIIL